MAVTLASTGITFPDGSTQTTAASGLSVQAFNSNGTWNHSSAGSPATILAYGVGGSGQGKNSGYQSPARGGGAGGNFIAQPISVSGNVAVNVGTGGSGNHFCGFYSYYCVYGRPGNATNVGGAQANGGGGYYRQNQASNPGGTGGAGGSMKGGGGNNGGSTNAGTSGNAYIVW